MFDWYWWCVFMMGVIELSYLVVLVVMFRLV